MGQIGQRHLEISLPKGQSAFLWGPRRTGKTYWLKKCFLRPEHHFIDLLKTDVYFEYASRPSLLRERWKGRLTVIDEIQKAPLLLDEIHWLIENKSASFLLTGSSAGKLRRSHANLLAGRAWRFEMAPLSFYEVKGFSLQKAMISGLLPPHFLSSAPVRDLRAYIADYLKEEIADTARIKNIPAFAGFLRTAALTNAELLNYTNVGRETGISAKVVRNYFEILYETFLAYRLPPWRASKKRKMTLTDKFYFFDMGVSNYLAGTNPSPGNLSFGKSFEHYILMELMAWKKYRNPELNLSFWRASSGYEVDFICHDMHTVIEVKSSSRIHKNHLKGLKALKEEHKPKNIILVCLEREPRTVDKNIQILPYRHFLKSLWKENLLD